MLEYWKRAFTWALQKTELLTWGKVVTSVGIAVVNLALQAGAGLRPWDATWQFIGITLAAYALVTAASFGLNTLVRAPVTLDQERGEQIRTLEEERSSG